MQAPLTIYRASAGAGKTFRLVVEYIKLLMLRSDEYKHILAVTFTKKATAEMKIRILSQLYGLREGLSSSDGYLNCISKEIGMPKADIRKNAGIALEKILNDYGHFRIETIDSFFQRVLRNMTRELDISSNMRVELNGEQIKDKAVDSLIDKLEPKDHIFQRVVDFANENMEEGKTWNVVNGLKEFGSNIFTNFYQDHSDEYKKVAENAGLFKKYKENLYALITAAENEITAIAGKLRAKIEEHGFDISDFKNSNRSGLGKLYERIEAGNVLEVPATVYKYNNDEKEWLPAKVLQKLSDPNVISRELMPALDDFLKVQERLASIINTSNVIKSNLNNIELLGAIEDAVQDSNIQANRFLLSSTNQLLSKMIDDADSPFIYEKIGTQVKHLMIDEFQDTSTQQWANFKKLLLECMSHYDADSAQGTIGSMIVGDVKQSIYRWRDGDWKLLDNIQSEFPNESDTKIEPLNTNFRSEANIINFNNAFFLNLKELCGIGKAYDDVAQKVKPGRIPKGEIEFYMLSANLYKQRHKMICDKVNELIDKGVKPKNIAILGRNASILKELSRTFMDIYPEIRVVSMESFVLNTSVAVRTIISALRLLVKPEDKIRLATLAKYSGIAEEECAKILENVNTSSSLLDIVESVFVKFNIESMKDDSAYVSAFFDHLRDFTSNNTSTIRNFLKTWDEKISAKAIETESDDGVSMMTIHKSKGLEFDNVIIADGNWSTSVSKNRIWVELKEKPFSDIPFTLVRMAQKLENSLFSDDYQEECFQNVVDNLNLLYVAFTRAGKNLYYFGETSRKNFEDLSSNEQLKKYTASYMSGMVENCLDTMTTDDLEETTSEWLDPEDKECFYYVRHFGDFAASEEEDEDTGNVFDMEVSPLNLELRFCKPNLKFMQSNRSKEFIASLGTADDCKEASGISDLQQSYISTGLLLHYVLSQINSIDEVDTVLAKLEMEGVISDKSYSSLIKKRINGNEYAKYWYAPGWEVYNEQPILTSKGSKRSDRVITNGKETIVIDFKFATPNEEHEKQVKAYKEFLQQVGLPNVKGYLWYVYTNKVQEV